ncbi:unnamed protein product [Echinostoma caproni]|uniref:Uncharacterized protein n=1 Tax=Echinostoma caproni TaxID=27848 RepID=A0A183B6K2_9TREM|nr:unnamed protein product [Echinostoma caproni]
MLKRLRECLTDRFHEADIVHQFQTDTQIPGEFLASSNLAIRRLALDAVPNTHPVDSDTKILTQTMFGTRHPLVRHQVLLNPQSTVVTELDTTRRIQQFEAVLRRDQITEVPNVAPVGFPDLRLARFPQH